MKRYNNKKILFAEWLQLFKEKNDDNLMRSLIKLITMILIVIILLISPLNILKAGELMPSGKYFTDRGKINTDIKQFINLYTGGYLILPFKDIDISIGSEDLSLSLIRPYNTRSRGCPASMKVFNCCSREEQDENRKFSNLVCTARCNIHY